MESDPAPPTGSEGPPLDAFADPLLVDPEPSLLRAVVESFRAAAPALVDPGIDELRAAATADGDPLAEATGLPSLTVLADETVVDEVTDEFRAASQLAALVEADVCRLLTGISVQPNPVLAGENRGCVLVPITGEGGVGTDADSGEADVDGNLDGDSNDSGEADADGDHRTARVPDRWVSIGDDPSLRARYAALVEENAAVEAYGLRTPSRHRVYAAFRDRCDVALADGVIRAIDANAEQEDGRRVDARSRAYAVGVCHGALDGDLRRACEDAGLGSPSTFTRIKREFREAGLLATESVPQPVGRPRERLVARGALADIEGEPPTPAAVVEAVRDAR